MTNNYSKSILQITALLSVAIQPSLHAATPNVQTPAPVIYLQDNLDENANLGWCIDTVGRGFAEQIHAHSCKPRGGDVQFSFSADSGNIESVEFVGKCLTVIESGGAMVAFGLLDCIAQKQTQQFSYDTDSMQFHPGDDTSLCMVVGESSRKAGPFMSRDLMIAECADTDSTLSKWVIKGS